MMDRIRSFDPHVLKVLRLQCVGKVETLLAREALIQNIKFDIQINLARP